MSALKEAFDLMQGFTKHNVAPPSEELVRGKEDFYVERTFSDQTFHDAMKYLGNLKQLVAYEREIWGYWVYIGENDNRFVVAVTKRKVKKDE